VLFQGDFSLPAAGQPANDHIKALVPILEKLNLDFDRYINVHTSATPQTKAERNRDAFRFLVLRYQRSIFKYFDQKTRQM